jgi:hypothetical protein
MPRGDKTGPMGMGPMTGRVAGICAGNTVPEFTSAPGGRGFRGGRGQGGRGQGGRGRRNRFCATGRQGAPTGPPASGDRQEAVASETSPDPTSDASKQQALNLLKSEAQRYANGLEQMQNRIAEIEAELHKQ